MHFSVVIPLYNKAPYVAKAIESVLSQTFTDFELIIVDDGSKDDSFSVAQKAIDGHGNCRIYRQQNAGVSVARNRGVAFSQGEYLCFLDADDWWDERFLEEVAQLIEAFPDAGIYGTNYTIVNETKRKTRISPIGVEAGFEKGYINYCTVFTKTLAMPLWTGAVCIPRPVFDEMQGFPKGVKLGEDFILWVHIALKHKVAFLNKPLSYYNQDVDLANRGVGHLHKPDEHMLWNLKDLELQELVDSDYKALVDALRVNGLMGYYITKEYHEKAKEELGKVDWSKQSFRTKREYGMPVWCLKLKYSLMKVGSKVKQWLICLVK